MYIRVIAFFLFVFSLYSCKRTPKTTADTSAIDSSLTYFSMNQFVDDQVNTYSGQPFSLIKLVQKDGKTDSTMVNVETIEWAPIITALKNSDISDKKFLGLYHFSMFEEEVTGNRVFFYEAADPKLFTRQLQFTVDPTTMKIISMYVETLKNGTWGTVRKKVLYKPLELIQLQESETPLVGSARNFRVDYRFL